MAGATSSAVHALVVEEPSARTHRLVLRRYVDREWLGREPDLAEREAEVLMILGGTAVASPRLVGVDPDGAASGVPSVLMSWLDGRPCAGPPLRDHLDDFAALLPQVHATAVPTGSEVRAYRPYYTGGIDPREFELVPPPWSARPELWEVAIERYRAWTHPGDGVLLHRDYHPGNVLFVGERLSGLVDWVNASIGPPDLDVGHCRANLTGLLDLEAADRFRDRWLVEAGLDRYDPMADILAVVGLLPTWARWFEGAEGRMEELVGRALTELGRT
ncbi:MAG TPA: aminoglycoside phosphotransferase family protein [Acidimicrobiales bacterium]|nr:aminoglycoside phosphotransferase family protein [Acidimicrobiales bacterium]